MTDQIYPWLLTSIGEFDKIAGYKIHNTKISSAITQQEQQVEKIIFKISIYKRKRNLKLPSKKYTSYTKSFWREIYFNGGCFKNPRQMGIFMDGEFLHKSKLLGSHKLELTHLR